MLDLDAFPDQPVIKEEREVVNSIYSGACEDIAPVKSEWGTYIETGWWGVTLKVHEDRVSVQVRVKMNKSYPQQSPVVKLHNPVGLTAQHVRQLLKELQDVCQQRIGHPVVWDLAVHAENWIMDNHIPFPKNGEPEKNLLDQLHEREAAQKAAAEEYMRTENKGVLQAKKEEARKVLAKIELEGSRTIEEQERVKRMEEERERQQALSLLPDGVLTQSTITLDREIKLGESSWQTWRLFDGKPELLWTTYVAEPVVSDDSSDTNLVKTRMPLILPTLWAQVVDFSATHYLGDQGRKKIDSLVSEISHLQTIVSENVLKVYAVKRDRSPKGWERVIVFAERPPGGALLESRLPECGFDCLTAVNHFRQIITGLQAIHSSPGNRNTQKLFDPRFVVSTSGKRQTAAVKLMGTAYAKRIIDYHNSDRFLTTDVEINDKGWMSEDERLHPQDYHSRRDIWNSAILFLELLLGTEVSFVYKGFVDVCANFYLPEPVHDLLASMFHPQGKQRPGTKEVLERLSEIEANLTLDMKSARLGSSISSQFLGDRKAVLPSPRLPHRSLSMEHQPIQQQGPSRYRHDYDELEKLGEGGFGMVVKARNQYDQKVYAVKKIKLRGEDRNLTDKEIQIISVLSHRNIVRYFNCWIEEPIREVTEPDTPLTVPSGPAVDAISDPFAPPNPTDPFANKTDNSKSISFPPVRFSLATRRQDEDSSDDSESDEDSDEDSGEETESELPAQRKEKIVVRTSPDVPSSAYTGTTQSDPTAYRTLYIAMEFVDNGTLRELIDKGLSVSESWRLFQEVLDALSYLHSQSVVHRDLKPSNILINGYRQAIVADFGLSTFSAATAETVDSGQAVELQLTGTKTSNIGTAAYIAPEVVSGRTYDAKADLYSLGVIFFEMNFPPMMGQERMKTITDLRSPSITFPASWPADRPNQRKLLEWLLDHDPSARPTADMVLASPLMPMELKSPAEYSKAIATLTTDRSAKPYKQLLDAIFNPAPTGRIDLVTERSANWLFDDDFNPLQEATEVWSAVIVKRLKDLCHRHGAQETYLPPLIPETKLLEQYDQTDCVRLLDRGGQLAQMIGCDLIAMARSAPRRHVGRRKRFHLGMEYHPSMPGRQPTKAVKLSFDIVSPLRSAAAEVEMIEVVDKIIAEFRGTSLASEAAGYEFHISHETILSSVLSLAPRHKEQVLAAFKSIGKTSDRASTALNRVYTALDQKTANNLKSCATAGDFYDVRTKLQSVFAADPSSRRKVRAALEEMTVIVTYLETINIERKIVFRPTLASNAELFRGGFMFECVAKRRTNNPMREQLAYGGRYDTLLEHFDTGHLPQATTYGVGMSISIDHLAKMVSEYESELSKKLMGQAKEEERSFGYWTPSRCDVYVAAGSQVDLSIRLKLIAELWRSGISADLQYDDERTLEDVTKECEDQSTPFLVLPRVNKTDIKVRSILRRNEKEVPREELCAHLRAAIAEQKRIDATYASHEGSISSSQAAAMSIEARPAKAADIRLILPPDEFGPKGKSRPVKKNRHTTKSVYNGKIQDFLTSTRSTLPVIAVDVPASILAQLAINTAWITEDEAWKAVLTDPAIDDRKYAETVREGVRKLVKDENQNVIWLFGVREGKEGKGILLQYK